ncbi:MAG: DUF86 domain-containing protein [Tildeniella nuda ZEHNDER 1965/U140]|jgi:uncharacterized protein with HEPN domain|nr:DUF86 domain-containing protein [Tildeniella nuda ZEHNDER 1965/U140]
MSNRSLLLELCIEIDEAIRRIERRFTGIHSPEDFICDDNGLDRLDGISMMLIAISENIKRLEKIAGADFLNQYPDIPWLGIKGIRNILAHDYFNLDAEEIYKICSSDLEPLKQVLVRMRGAV